MALCGCFNTARAFWQTSFVILSEYFEPSNKTSRAIFFILPRIFLSPYTAALLALLEAPLNKASFRISKPSSCIQDRLKAARRAVDELDEYNCSRSFSRSFMLASSFSRPEGFLFSNLINSPLNMSARTRPLPNSLSLQAVQLHNLCHFDRTPAVCQLIYLQKNEHILGIFVHVLTMLTARASALFTRLIAFFVIKSRL